MQQKVKIVSCATDETFGKYIGTNAKAGLQWLRESIYRLLRYVFHPDS